MLAKVIGHARNGTLLKVARTKIRHSTVGNRAVGNAYYGDRASMYEEERQGKQYWEDQQRIAEGLIADMPDGISVLDVPFGSGRFADAYNAKHMKVSGLEISPEMVAAARARRKGALDGYDIRIGDARQLPWDDDSFDLVMSFRFLSEIVSLSDAKQVMREIARVAKGTAILDLGIRDPQLPPLKRPPRDHERSGVSFTDSEIRSMLRQAGLEVRSTVPQYRSGDGHRHAVICTPIAGGSPPSA